MLKASPTKGDLFDAIIALMERKPEPFIPGKTRIPLNVPSYGPEEVMEALDSMLSTYVTMGAKVKAFENAWAAYIGVKHAVMTNSGSSANLLALSALHGFGMSPGAQVITPALTWATTVFPIAQAGYVPVLVDVDRASYNVSIDAVWKAITPRTRAIMPVHLLGNPCDMGRLMDICEDKNLMLIEDACEAHGAEWRGQKVGSFGECGTFSFFFSHHISTIEGGMVVTDDDLLADQVRKLRAFGWIREAPDRAEIALEHPDIDPRFLFEYPGFNFRPTEIAGAFGIHQVPRLEGYLDIRRDNMAYWNQELAQWREWIMLPSEAPGTRHAGFAHAVTVKEGAPFTRKALQDHLEANGVETRPIQAGNMAAQPAMQYIKHRIEGDLKNAQTIHERAFFIGNHHGITPPIREAVVSYVNAFMRRF